MLFKKIKTFFVQNQKLAKQEYKNKLIRNSIARKSKHLKHNLYIDNVETVLKVQWLKNDQLVCDYLSTAIELDYNYCYLINCAYSFNTIGYQIEIDVVVVDLNWNVIHLYKSLPPNTKNISFDKVGHIFVFAKNSIDVLEIKEDSQIRPMPKV